MNNDDFFIVKNLNFAYERRPYTLKDVNFKIKKGEKILLLASKDMGKTTFLSVISSFQDSYFGEILINETELRDINDNEKSFSLLFSTPVFDNKKTVLDNFNIMRSNNNLIEISNEDLVIFLSKYNININPQEKIKKLSIIQRRELAMVRAVMRNTDIVFIDDQFEDIDNTFENTNKIYQLYEHFLNSNKTIFCAIGDNTYKNLRKKIHNLKFDKIFYLVDASLFEIKSLKDFENNPINENQLLFLENDCTSISASILKLDEKYYFEYKNILIHTDELSDEYFDRIKLLNLDNSEYEDVNIIFKRNKDYEIFINKPMVDGLFLIDLIKEHKVMIFAKIGGERLI